ncbi:hypothetical protein HYU23_03210 [Candidatus Woesearchaeota archaeon]|nr:hypothetical protein [Candidatus Woesearchaeota archaeon]
MKNKFKIILILAILFLLLAWSPWITKNYAINKVTNKLGGPNKNFNYLGENMQIKDVPKYVLWLPFVKAVYFPSEAVWFVTFYGGII